VRIFEDGQLVDATFTVEPSRFGLTVVFHARAGSGKTRNAEYARGLRLLCRRLPGLGLPRKVELASRTAADWPAAERTLLDRRACEKLIEQAAPAELANEIMRRAAKAGRKPGAKGSGNPSKRVRLFMDWRGSPDAGDVEAALSRFVPGALE